MPPRFRQGDRGKAPISAPNDHEAGPSGRRTPSATRSIDPREPWRIYEEPARQSTSHSSTPPYHHSFGPQSENEPNNPQPSYIPLQRSASQDSFRDPTPVFQGQFNPAEYLPEQVGFNPLGPEDHFSGDQDMDEDTDPVEASTGSLNHPFVISDGSSFHRTPYQGPDSHMARFERCEWYYTPSYHSSPHQQPPQQQQDPSGDPRFEAVTPPPPPPPVHLEPPEPPRRRRTGARMSSRGGEFHFSTPQHSSGSHYPPIYEDPQVGGPSVPVSEVNSAPIAPPSPGFGHPIPAYTAPAAYNPYGPPAYHNYNYAEADPYLVAANYLAQNPEGPYGTPWGIGHPARGYQVPAQPPPQYQPPRFSPPEQEDLRQRLGKVERDLQRERKKNEGFMSGLANLLKGKKKRDR